MLEPNILSKERLVRVGLSFYANHFHQSAVNLLEGHTPTT